MIKCQDVMPLWLNHASPLQIQKGPNRKVNANNSPCFKIHHSDASKGAIQVRHARDKSITVLHVIGDILPTNCGHPLRAYSV